MNVEKDVLKDTLPDGSKIRALVVILTAKDGRKAFGLSSVFSELQAKHHAYSMLLNMPKPEGKP